MGTCARSTDLWMTLSSGHCLVDKPHLITNLFSVRYVRTCVRLRCRYAFGNLAEAGVDTSPVDRALDQLVTGLDHLVKVVDDGGLDHYDDLALVGFVQAFERFRNWLSLVDYRVIVDAEFRRLAEVWVQPGVARVLVSALRISAGEARRRVSAAEAVGSGTSMTGERLEPRRPVLAVG